MGLATRIRTARMRAGLSQHGLAERLGVSRGAVANWECTKEVQPTSERLRAIAKTTGVAHEWLATGRGRMFYDTSQDEVPAVDAEFVEDRLELRLLRAYREASRHKRARLLELAESRP
ncbi:MAG: helix-turn-helix transcriptional regulator [Pseudoxanthomonas sp.]